MRLLKKCYRIFALLVFFIRGKKPWKFGYNEYKKQYIRKHYIDFDPDIIPQGYGLRIDERAVEYPWMFSRLPEGNGNLLDAGSILNYNYILNHPKLKTKKIYISTLAPEKRCFWTKGVSYIYEDLREICFKNDFFNWVVCLSTLEHIGLDNTFLYTDDMGKKEENHESYLKAVVQYRRILKEEGILYLSFPYGRYSDHEWFQVFDSLMVEKILDAFKPRKYRKYYFKYEPYGWHKATEEEVKLCTYFDIQKNKYYDNDYAAASRAVLCMELKK